MSAAQLIAPNGAPLTHKYHSGEIVRAAFSPDHLHWIEERRALVSSRRTIPVTCTYYSPILFESVAARIIKESVWGSQIDQEDGVFVWWDGNGPQVAIPDYEWARTLAATEAVRSHNDQVGFSAGCVAMMMIQNDPDIAKLLCTHQNIPKNALNQFLSRNQAVLHDVGKFSGLTFPYLVGGVESNIQTRKLMHIIIGASLVDYCTGVEDIEMLTLAEVDHFVMQLGHHWFLEQYPNRDYLPTFRNYQDIVPLVYAAFDLLTGVQEGTKLVDILEEVLCGRDPVFIKVFLGAIKAQITSLVDSYIAMLESKREYMMRTGTEFTPEEALHRVSSLAVERGIPKIVIKSLSDFSETNRTRHGTPLHYGIERFVAEIIGPHAGRIERAVGANL